MKKNISINIGGIIFHIEEDSYDRLNDYLTSINRYFETFDDSKEIIADIEHRIAEIFLTKLSDSKQVIAEEDIEALIATMGTVADFEAQIEIDADDHKASDDQSKERSFESASARESSERSKNEEKDATQQKRLYRNNRERVLGGVASGIAHYFSIDPIWIRLLFLALFFNLLLVPLSGTTLLVYLVLWIVLPGSDELEEDKSYKKLYRNPDDRVIGGVSGGLASFFGVDVVVIRLLFVLSGIFGAGILLYIILWIITPEAKSITEKMQMQGEPVTLSNIESNVKNSLKVSEGEENVFVKILLFPFRLIALIINGLGKALGPLLKFLVDAIRILFGFMVILLGISLMLSFVVLWGVLIGLVDGWSEHVHLGDIPLELFMNDFNFVTATAFSAAFFIPALAITLLGAVIIVRHKIGNSYLGWSLFGLWLTSLILSAVMIPELVRDFRTDEDIRKEMVVGVADPTSTPTLKLNPVFEYQDYDGVDLRLRGHSDSTYKAVIRYEARGEDREDALANANAMEYKIVQKNGDLYFDEELDFEGKDFKFQTADVIFYIPFGQQFKMDGDLKEILVNTLHLNDYRSYQMEGNDWTFDQSGIVCLTCDEASSYDDYTRKRRDRKSSSRNYGDENSIIYAFEDFDEIKISSMINVEIEKSDNYEVALRGRNADEASVSQIGSEIRVKYKDDWQFLEDNRNRDNELYLYISTPDVEALELSGGCEGTLTGFDTSDMEITLNGASDLDATISPDRLKVYLSGASTLSLDGESRTLDIQMDGASSINAFEFVSDYIEIEANGASKAKVYVNESLEVQASGVSQIRYRGNGRLNSDADGLSTVKRD